MKMHRWLTPEVRFWHYVDKRYWFGKSCWQWLGNKAGRGYGQFQIDGKKVFAHRFSWEHHNGPIPSGKFVCHSCDNVLCVNPDHLFISDHVGNMRDMTSKERHWAMKIFGQDREDIGKSDLPTHILAGAYGVNRTTIQRIRRKARAALKVLR